MADLERCYDEQASRLRAGFVAEVAAALTKAKARDFSKRPPRRASRSAMLLQQERKSARLLFMEVKMLVIFFWLGLAVLAAWPEGAMAGHSRQWCEMHVSNGALSPSANVNSCTSA